MGLNYLREARLNWHAGMVSFLAQRITGVALVLYLVLHLLSLSTSLMGSSSFDRTMTGYAKGIVFHAMEWLLLVAVLFHMLNGLRIIAADWLGITHLQRGMFWVAGAVTGAV
ncbi:MAG: succinate dehydrogenase, cytochrome b556 subunit, partial [Deltaproteobacteria bacterium]|nr:succinate dehydrogenase, cytochrome b556 subunit [Deltaproteobacteria bacterium]